MQRLRRIATALVISWALLVGHHVALVHALGHAVEQVGGKGGSPESTCAKHFACSQLSSGVDASIAPLVILAAGTIHAGSKPFREVCLTARLAYRSHAPPAASV